MNFGGAGGVKTLSEQRKAQLLESYKTVVNHASSIPGSIIIDGGTKSGVMELMGKAYSASANKQNTALVGVVPASKGKQKLDFLVLNYSYLAFALEPHYL